MKTILAIGSPFGADRIGWQIADQLQAMGVQQVHTCRHPIDLLPHFLDNSDCVVIDALWANLPNGTLLEIHPNDLKPEHCTNAHGLNLYEVIQLASISEQLPEHLTIYGIEMGKRIDVAFNESEVAGLTTLICRKLDIPATEVTS